VADVNAISCLKPMRRILMIMTRMRRLDSDIIDSMME
jgi:hypothetical protein